jgi:DNA-binding MarR family transcriptional regulator
MKTDPLAQNELDDLAFGLFRIGLHLVRSERGLGSGKDTLRIPKLSALAAVADGESIPVDKLAQAEGVQEPTMSVTLQILEAKDLVELEEDPKDGRLKHAKPTQKTQKQLVRGKRRLSIILREAEIDRARAAKLAEAVTTITSVIDAYKDKQEERRQARRRRRTPKQGGG